MTRAEAIEAMDRKWRVRITHADPVLPGDFDGVIHSIEGKSFCRIRLGDGSLQGAMTKHVFRIKDLRQ